jgi:3-oxoadipate enol-lactonase/4-carboxymuconolactone decarboxylase
MPFVDRAGVRIYWRSDGHPTAPPLLLSNSLGTDCAFWDPVMPRLTEYFHVVRMDTRGHGASDSPPGPYSMPMLADDTLAVADAAGLQRFAFAGVSMGGAIGMHLGIHHSARLTRLMLCNTAPSFPAEVFDQRIAAVEAGGMSAVVDGVLQRFFTEGFRQRNSSVVASVRSTLLGLDPVGYAGCCGAVRNANFDGRLGEISTPTLVLVGDHDQSTPPEKGRAIAAAIPDARVVALPVAHLSHPEQPAAFIDLAVPFLLDQALPNSNTLLDQQGPRSHETLSEGLDRGLARRRRTLGATHVDKRVGEHDPLTVDFQQLITRYAWDEIWNRPGLDPRTRRLLVLAITASMGRWEEFDLHINAGLEAELQLTEVKELLLQTAVYAGVPAGNTGFAHLKRSLAQRETSTGKPPAGS